MKKRIRPEILAPAGDFTCLQAALDAGADAVYFGLGTFNMRARSGVNFCEADLPEVAARCRAAGVKAYLTLNAIMFEDEAEEIDRLIPLLSCGDLSRVRAELAALLEGQDDGGADH